MIKTQNAPLIGGGYETFTNKRSLPKTEEQNKAMKLTVLNKYTRLWMTYNRKALHENRSLQASRICGCGFKERRDMRLMKRNNILAMKTGRRRLFEHTRDQGEQVETLGNQGRQSDT